MLNTHRHIFYLNLLLLHQRVFSFNVFAVGKAFHKPRLLYSLDIVLAPAPEYQSIYLKLSTPLNTAL